MGLAQRLNNANSGAAAAESAAAPSSLIGGTAKRRKDPHVDGSRRLKIRVHNRLLETLDVSKLDALNPPWCRPKSPRR